MVWVLYSKIEHLAAILVSANWILAKKQGERQPLAGNLSLLICSFRI